MTIVRFWVVAALLVAPVPVGAAERLALIVGNNAGYGHDRPLRYAESDAERVAKALIDLGGFSRSQVIVHLGGDERDLRGAMARAGAALSEDAGLLFFYYSGHSDGENLHVGGTRLPVDEVQAFLDGAPAQVRLALVDSCKSGALTRAKGASLGPAFAVDVFQDASVEGKIVITSSSEDEISQESDSIQSSFFTHYWVSGLYGGADANQDGLITLEEAYRFAHFHTLQNTIASRAGVQHPSFDFALTGQGNVVLARLHRSTARVDIRVGDVPGTYFILDADKRLVLTEILRTAAGGTSVRLPPGRYRIQKREPRELRVLDVELEAGERLVIADRDMEAVAYGHETGKGLSLHAAVIAVHEHGPRVVTSVRSPIVDDMSPTPEVQVGYRLRGERVFLEPRMVARFGVVGGTGPTHIRHWELDFGASVGMTWALGRVRLSGGLDAGLIAFFEDEYRNPNWVPPSSTGGQSSSPAPMAASSVGGAFPIGIQAAGFGEASVRLFGELWLGVVARVGVAAFKVDERNDTSVAYGAGLSLAYRLE